MPTSTFALHAPLIPASANRPSDDPIFALHAEAARRRKAGVDVLDATIGTLCKDDGHIALMPSVFEAYRRVPEERAAEYAPISGPASYLSAVIGDLFEERASAREA